LRSSATTSPLPQLTNVTLSANSELLMTGAWINVTGGMTLDGKITMNVSASQSLLLFTGTQTIGGTGEIVLGTGTPEIWLNQTGMTLTIAPLIEVHGGSGWIRNNTGNGVTNTTLINDGTIRADAAGTLTISPNTLTNTGTMKAQGATLNASSATVTNFSSGTLTGGTWQATSGHVPWKQDFKKLAVRSQARAELSGSYACCFISLQNAWDASG